MAKEGLKMIAKQGNSDDATTFAGFPGTIVLSSTEGGTMAIIDGQHRVGAISLLAAKNKWQLNEPTILTEVYDVKNEEEVSILFTNINKAEPGKFCA